jgi:ABC-2 type transport system ATP-binding protein
MAQTADHLVVIGPGRLQADQPIAQLQAQTSETATRGRSPEAADMSRELGGRAGVSVTIESPDTIVLHGLDPAAIGHAAAQHGWTVLELTPLVNTLEDAYLHLTEDAVEYRSAALAGQAA